MPNTKPPKKPRAKTGRKAGAQPGNKNALRHGFYSADFTPAQNKKLDGTNPLDVTDEIKLLQVQIDTLNRQISYEEIIMSDEQGNQWRNDHYLQQLNTLNSMLTAKASLVRTHYLTHGKSEGVQNSILEALEIVRIELGI